MNSDRPDPALAAQLRSNPHLAKLGDDDLTRIAAYLTVRDAAPGTTLIGEHECTREIFVVVSGQARLERSGLDLGSAGPGDLFGELGLLVGRPRAASVIAASPMQVASLTLDAYDALAAADPALALRLTRVLVDTVAGRLGEMTESVGALLRERSLPRRTHVTVQIGDQALRVRTGTPLDDLLPTEIDGELVVGGQIDRRAASLSTPLTADCEVEPITTGQWAGQRSFRNSLALLLLEAAYDVVPELDVHVEHSVGFAQRIAVKNGVDAVDYEALAERIGNRMRDLCAEDYPLREELWTVDEARAHFDAAGWRATRALLDTWRDPTVMMVAYGHVYVLGGWPLVPRTGLLTGFQLLCDDHGLLLVYGPRGTSPDTEASVLESIASAARQVSRSAGAMIRAHERWLGTLGISSVGELNRACLRGDVSQVIRVAEGFHEKRSSIIADRIHGRDPRAGIVCIAGPSSAGKTTFIRRLEVQLQVDGLSPVRLSLDDYYRDREATPRDEHGEYDFEAFEALDHPRLRDHLQRLLAGDEVQTSRFDFVAGRALPEGGRRLRLRENDILLLEGIHALNPELLDDVGAGRTFRLFVCPLAQLPFDRATRVHASDVRLLRRIVRDRHGRGTTAADTILRWPSVRRGERRHIFPYQHHADAVFDSSLIYELSVLKVYAERYLLEVPHHSPAYSTAFRLLQLTDRFVTIYPDHVPPTSLLREFIGGSGFDALHM